MADGIYQKREVDLLAKRMVRRDGYTLGRLGGSGGAFAQGSALLSTPTREAQGAVRPPSAVAAAKRPTCDCVAACVIKKLGRCDVRVVLRDSAVSKGDVAVFEREVALSGGHGIMCTREGKVPGRCAVDFRRLSTGRFVWYVSEIGDDVDKVVVFTRALYGMEERMGGESGEQVGGASASGEQAVGGASASGEQAVGGTKVLIQDLKLTSTTSGVTTYALNGNNMTVAGNFSVSGTKMFDIPHPDPAKQGYRLKHLCVEAPTRGENMYRFKVQTCTPDERFVIDLPAYFTHLNEDAQVFVTPVDVQSDVFADVVYNDEGGATVQGTCQLPGRYNVLVIATRKDASAISGFDGTGIEYVG